MSAELEKACTSGERRSDRQKRFPLGLGDGWTDSEGDGDNETVTQVAKKSGCVCRVIRRKVQAQQARRRIFLLAPGGGF